MKAGWLDCGNTARGPIRGVWQCISLANEIE